MLYMENTERLDTEIENGSEWSNGMAHFDRTGPTKKSGPPRKAGRFFYLFIYFFIWPGSGIKKRKAVV